MQITSPLIQQVLSEQFGLQDLRPKQKEIIECLLNGENALALLPTGYGKSLCYQLPSQMFSGVTLVISPLIALMQDQVSGLERRGITSATVLNSTLSFAQITERIDGIRNGAYKLVYVAPERFDSPRFRELIANLDISLLVIDEAHCISQWGHDFRPQYRNLGSHLPALRNTVILALTATATPTVQKDIVVALGLPNMRVVSGGFDRPNLRFEVQRLSNGHAKDAFVQAAIAESDQPAIVYTSSKKEAERLAHVLVKGGIKAACYHAGLGGELRQRTQRRFEQDELQAIVGTVAFGMGIDKPNIRRVIHYNLPSSLEDYYQQAGRAGRDGLTATCTLLYQPRDIFIQKWLIGKNYPSSEQLHSLMNLLRRLPERGATTGDILAQIDFEDSALNSALDHLKALGVVKVSDSGAIFCPAENRMAEVDFERLWQRRRRDEERLNSLVRYAEQSVCRRQAILYYFGERLQDKCQGCDVCSPDQFEFRVSIMPEEGGTRINQASRTSSGGARSRVANQDQMNRSILTLAKSLSGKVGRTSLTAILMGSRSKKILSNGFDANSEYGALRGFSEQKLLAAIDDMVADGILRVTTGMYPKVFATAKTDKRLEELS